MQPHCRNRTRRRSYRRSREIPIVVNIPLGSCLSQPSSTPTDRPFALCSSGRVEEASLALDQAGGNFEDPTIVHVDASIIITGWFHLPPILQVRFIFRLTEPRRSRHCDWKALADSPVAYISPPSSVSASSHFLRDSMSSISTAPTSYSNHIQKNSVDESEGILGSQEGSVRGKGIGERARGLIGLRFGSGRGPPRKS